MAKAAVDTTSDDLPIQPHRALVNTEDLLHTLSAEIQQMDIDELEMLLPDLEHVAALARRIHNAAEQRIDAYDVSSGRLRSGSVVVKMVNDCGPYGYLVRWTGERQEWKYLGKAASGIDVGTYAPGTALEFEKGRGADKTVTRTGNWSDE